jgi:hypothetical protein
VASALAADATGSLIRTAGDDDGGVVVSARANIRGARFANVFGLMPSSTRELRVDARDNFGNVAQGNVLLVTTPAPTNSVAPTAPTSVQLGFQSGNGEAWLRWHRSTDDADPQHLDRLRDLLQRMVRPPRRLRRAHHRGGS